MSLSFGDKGDLIQKELYRFYSNHKNNFDVVYNIVNRKDDITLRLIDFFCLKYTKKNKYVFFHKIRGEKIRVDVQNSYHEHLKAYSGEYFTLFKRKKGGLDRTFEFSIGDKSVKTTIAQLNFFKWCIKYGIIDQIRKNIKDITADLKNS